MIRGRFKKALWLILTFVSGFGVGLGIKLAYETSSFKPYRWNIADGPIIANCYGKDFSELQMVRAVEYWVLRGEKIGFYEHDPPEEICQKKWAKGFIIIRKSEKLRFQSTVLASTRRYTSFETIHGAIIDYKPGAHNLDLINEHELGHALGYAHVEIKGHVMHPLYHKMGRDFWIPAD